MLGRQFRFIFALCLAAVVIWLLGEALFILVLELGSWASWVWTIAAFVGVCAFSVWKCPRE